MPDQLDQLDPVTGLPHHLRARPVEQTRQALPKKHVVVRQDHPQPADGPLVAITILTSPLLARARHTVSIDQPGARGPDATAVARIPGSRKRGTAGLRLRSRARPSGPGKTSSTSTAASTSATPQPGPDPEELTAETT